MLESRDLTNNLHVMKEKLVRSHTLIDAGMIMTDFIVIASPLLNIAIFIAKAIGLDLYDHCLGNSCMICTLSNFL